MRRIMACALLLIGSMGCEDDPGTAPPPTAEDTFGDEWSPTDPAVSPAPGVKPQALTEGRRAKRITVDQLRRSLPDLFGGETWTVTVNNREFELIDALSRTLGEPDYIEVTEFSNEPTPLFHKFMDDLATQLCTKAVERDARTRDPAERILVPDPQDVDQTLRFLRLKFHGIHVPADAEADGLDDYRTLYTGIASEADPAQAWIGVCIAMFTAPEFMAW